MKLFEDGEIDEGWKLYGKCFYKQYGTLSGGSNEEDKRVTVRLSGYEAANWNADMENWLRSVRVCVTAI